MQTLVGYHSIGKGGRPNEDRYRLLGGGFVVPDNRATAFKETKRGEIYAVMDGVGGAPKGMAAAQYIADKLVAFYTQPSALANELGIESILQQANTAIFDWGFMLGTDRPCGASTVTLCWFSPDRKVHIIHSGDSAGFLHTVLGLRQVTHNQEDTNGIYAYVGQGNGFCPERNCYSLSEGDVVCLVTDGVTKGMNKYEMQVILENYAGEPGLAAKVLVESAKRKGVQDDITALVIELDEW